MEVKPLRTIEEIEEFVRRNYGSREDYLRREAGREPASDSLTADYFDLVAKAAGYQTVEQLFTARPDIYKRYKDSVTVAV